MRSGASMRPLGLTLACVVILAGCGGNNDSGAGAPGAETPSLRDSARELVDALESGYVDAGATREQAACISDALVSGRRSGRPIEAGLRKRVDRLGASAPLATQLLRKAYRCAPPASLLAIAESLVDAPLRQRLRAAGASSEEAACLVVRVPNIAVLVADLEDTEPALRTAAFQQFRETGRSCAPPGRLMDFWERLESAAS